MNKFDITFQCYEGLKFFGTLFTFYTNNLIDNINTWFRCNLLLLNFDKTYFLHFRNKNSYEMDYQNKLWQQTGYKN